MEVVEAYFDDDKQRSLEFYEDDDGFYRFEEWTAGGDEADRGWVTDGRFGEQAYETLEEARKQAGGAVGWYRPRPDQNAHAS